MSQLGEKHNEHKMIFCAKACITYSCCYAAVFACRAQELNLLWGGRQAADHPGAPYILERSGMKGFL